MDEEEEEAADYTQYKSIKKENGRANANKNTPDFTYEHFPVVCPSCEGTGSIEEDVSHMVTFVPVKDERLRPAWTKVKIVVLILIIIAIGGCTTYFLYPRTVTIQINAHNILAYDFQTSSPWIEYSFVMNVSNQNFFTITLKQLTMQMLYVEVIVGNRTFLNDYHVGMRTIKKDVVKMNASYDVKSVGRFIKKECYVNRNYVPQLMVSFAELSYWMHSQHIQSKDDYFFTDCDTMIFPYPILSTTPAKPTTPTPKRITTKSSQTIVITITPKTIFELLFSSTTSTSRHTTGGKLSYSKDKLIEKKSRSNVVRYHDQT